VLTAAGAATAPQPLCPRACVPIIPPPRLLSAHLLKAVVALRSQRTEQLRPMTEFRKSTALLGKCSGWASALWVAQPRGTNACPRRPGVAGGGLVQNGSRRAIHGMAGRLERSKEDALSAQRTDERGRGENVARRCT
jgi:hypothetical protein